MTNATAPHNLSGKIALETGASRGLGLEIATALTGAETTYSITAWRESWPSEAEKQLRESGLDVIGCVLELSDRDQVNSTVSRKVKRYGRIDILSNDAGASCGAPVDTKSLETFHEQSLSTGRRLAAPAT